MICNFVESDLRFYCPPIKSVPLLESSVAEFSDEVKNAWNYACIFPYAFMAWVHRYDVTLIYSKAIFLVKEVRHLTIDWYASVVPT